jgi:hypothetical protein
MKKSPAKPTGLLNINLFKFTRYILTEIVTQVAELNLHIANA